MKEVQSPEDVVCRSLILCRSCRSVDVDPCVDLCVDILVVARHNVVTTSSVHRRSLSLLHLCAKCTHASTPTLQPHIEARIAMH